MLNQVTVFGLISLANFITCVFIGSLLYVKGRHRSVNVAYCVFDFCIAFYALFYFLWQSSSNREYSILFFKLCILGVVLINSAFVHFTFVLLNVHRKYWKVLSLVHIVNVFFGYASIFLFYDHWKIKYTYGLWPVPTAVFHFYIVWWFAQVIYSFYLIYKLGISTSWSRKKQLFNWVFWATLVAYAGGATNWLVWYDVNFPPYLNSGIAIYTIVLAYAIFRHQLLGIEVIIKKTIVFAGLFAMIMGLVAFITTGVQGYMSRLNPLLVRGLGVLLALLLYEPVKNLLIHVTDKFLFQKRESFKVVLNRLASNIITILDVDRVSDRILATLRDSLRLESGAILLKDDNGKQFQIVNSFNVSTDSRSFDVDDPMISYLAKQSEIVNLEKEDATKDIPADIWNKLNSLNAKICVPLFLHNELIGILNLGRKKSDEGFVREELDFFPALAGQVAVALSNARLYDILKKSQIDFAQQAKMAAIGTLSAGISHEVKNPLQIIKGHVEMLRFNKKHGVYTELNKVEYESIVDESLDKIYNAVTRASGVIDRLSSFAKKPKELKVEPVLIDKVLDQALHMMSHEFDNYQITVNKDYQRSLPKVMADEHALEEVFFNLLNNARHAMVEKGSVTIKAAVNADKEIEVRISDSGPGIAKENLEKIFDPFFTTKDVTRNPDKKAITGSGLGLFLVREIVRRYDGRITVESEPGHGATFSVFFPVRKDSVHFAPQSQI